MCRLPPLFLSLAILSSCVQPARQDLKVDPRLSEILTRPRHFEGETVTVDGWMSFALEDHNLWLAAEDHERWDSRRCVSLANYDGIPNSSALNGRRVRATGIVRNDASQGGRIIRLGACRDLAIELVSVRPL